MLNSSDLYAEELQRKEDFDSVQDSNIQTKLHAWYGTLRLSPFDGKLNRNFVPLGKAGSIAASETMHNKSKLLIKKPKDLMLFKEKAKHNAILNMYNLRNPYQNLVKKVN